MDKEEIKKRENDYKFCQYHHGGARIFIVGESGGRQLMADLHLDKDFAEFINDKIKEYFEYRN